MGLIGFTFSLIGIAYLICFCFTLVMIDRYGVRKEFKFIYFLIFLNIYIHEIKFWIYVGVFSLFVWVLFFLVD